jgi:hypothetical protein
MSRILRRPMFRGGRVDSRGTGITSGLGYEKGGRVARTNYSVGGIGRQMANVVRVLDDTRGGSGILDEFGQTVTYKPSQTADRIVESTPTIKNPGEPMGPGMKEYGITPSGQAIGNPQREAAAEFLEAIQDPRTGGIDYKMAEMKIGRGVRLRGNESIEELIELFLYNTRNDAGGIAALAGAGGTLGAIGMKSGPVGSQENINFGGQQRGNFLAYEDGGRVGFNEKGFVGGDLLANPGKALGLDIYSITPKSRDYVEKQKYYQSYKPKTDEEIEELYNQKMDGLRDDLTMSYGIDDYSGYQKRIIEDIEDYSDPTAGKARFKQDLYNKDKAAIQDAVNYNVLIEDVINKQLKNNNNTSTITGKGTGGDETVDRKKIMEDNKELFAELLGGDKARGEDISNMLLSFAGKALRPEATVKGAFGEFFEEEAKRPSSKTKVDQAAAQLAINQYIKGEISRAELNKLIAMNNMKTNLGDRAYISNALEKATSFSNGVKDGIQRNPQRRGQSIRFKDVTSDQMSPENFKPGPEDIGIIFIETDTQRAYEFNNNLDRVEIYTR